MPEKSLIAIQLLRREPELCHDLVPFADCCEVILHLICAQDPEEPSLRLPHHAHLLKGRSAVTAHGADKITVL